MPYRTPLAPPPRRLRWPSLRTVALTLIALAGLAGLMAIVAMLTVVCGCTPSRVVVAPVRAASNDAANALAIVQRLELARIRQLAEAGMRGCSPGDVPCRNAAVDDAFTAEAPRIVAINASVKAQHAVAGALVDFDACSHNGGYSQTACEANAIAQLEALAPEVAQLIVAIRKEGAP